VRKGFVFESETDSEVIPKLTKYLFDKFHTRVTFRQLVMEVLRQLQGRYTTTQSCGATSSTACQTIVCGLTCYPKTWTAPPCDVHCIVNCAMTWQAFINLAIYYSAL